MEQYKGLKAFKENLRTDIDLDPEVVKCLETSVLLLGHCGYESYKELAIDLFEILVRKGGCDWAKDVSDVVAESKFDRL